MEEMPIECAEKDGDLEREGFVAKVYGILTVQLVLTSVFCILACTTAGSHFFLTHNVLAILMLVLSMATLIPLACCPKVARRVPINYILLLVFTVSEGYLVGSTCALYDPRSVLMAIGITSSIVLGLTIYATYTKEDYTMMGGTMVVLLVGLIVFGLVTAIAKVAFMQTLYCACGAVIFSLYIVLDTQLLLGRGHNAYSVDDYILAAMGIYLDIINLLLYLLRLFGDKRS